MHRKDRGNRTLETALGMLARYAATEGDLETKDLCATGDVPGELSDDARRTEKLRRDREKLYALVEYVKADGDRKAFIARYFGL